jgi:hypothetical protein
LCRRDSFHDENDGENRVKKSEYDHGELNGMVSECVRRKGGMGRKIRRLTKIHVATAGFE